MGKTEINLVILSPSSEVNKLTFTSLSTATTVGELREKVAATVATHPAPERQRLIYRGHALLDPKRSLRDIFTQEIIDNSETLSLHLVLPPESSNLPGNSSSSSNAHDIQRPRTPQQLQGHPTSAGSIQFHQQDTQHAPVQGPTNHQNRITPQPPTDPNQALHLHAQGILPNGQFPPQLQQAFAQFQAINAQLAAQLVAVGATPGLHGPAHHQAQIPIPIPQQQFLHQPALHHVIPQQQQYQQQYQQHHQQAASTHEQPPPAVTQQRPTPVGTPTLQANAQGIARSVTPRNTNTIIRENRGPNGERWQMVIQSGQVNVNPQNNVPVHPTAQAYALAPSISRHGSPASQGRQVSQASMSAGEVMHLQSSLAAMEAAMAGGNPLPEPVFEQAREMLRNLDLSHEGRSNMNTRLNNLVDRSNALRQTLNNHLNREAQERAAAQRATYGAHSSAVYVLSSPSGPQALLISPAGHYSAPWQLSGLGSVIPSSVLYHHNHQETPSQAQSARLQSSVGAQQAAPLVAQAQTVRPNANEVPSEQSQQQQQQQQQLQQQNQANQARDILRILLPLGGNLWLLIRLFGFVYFLTAGAGWRRTVLLGLAACLVFIAQTGAFRPVIQAIWDPIRRHAEGLVPLAGNEPQGAGPVRTGGNANIIDATQRMNQETTPQEAAERLLQERERRDVNVFRQGIRRIERAIALFVASLVPGVGERHIAAREAAEAVRLAEAREREEQAQQAEAEAGADTGRRDEVNASQSAGSEANAMITDGAASDFTTRENRNAQPPLVDV